jgi:predicted RNA binding protein YcfA (HicA-like mRNA interferase family)
MLEIRSDKMPRKKRDIKRDYRQAGFIERQGKGDHTNYSHPLLRDVYTVAGTDGDDARPYDEKNLRQALKALEDAKRSQQP